MIQRKKRSVMIISEILQKMHVTISWEYYFVLENSFTLDLKILFCTSLTKAEIFCENGGSILLWLGKHTVTKDIVQYLVPKLLVGIPKIYIISISSTSTSSSKSVYTVFKFQYSIRIIFSSLPVFEHCVLIATSPLIISCSFFVIPKQFYIFNLGQPE